MEKFLYIYDTPTVVYDSTACFSGRRRVARSLCRRLPLIEKLRLLSSCVRAFCRPQAKVRRLTVRREGKSTRRAFVESVILMPIATRRNPADPDERARQDDLPTVDNRDEEPQDQPQLQTYYTERVNRKSITHTFTHASPADILPYWSSVGVDTR